MQASAPSPTRRGAELDTKSLGPVFAPELDEYAEETAAAARAAVRSDGRKVSHEWNGQIEAGLDPRCWAPWRMLKIDIRSRTRICCNYAHNLPTFEWPSAKDFHRETGMWNHPFMQHMRRTMGDSDGVPFCNFCLTKDKRDPALFDEKKRVTAETQALYQRFMEAADASAFSGRIDEIEDLPAWTVIVPGKRARQIQPFRNPKHFYRDQVRRRGFHRLGRVLLLGCTRTAMAPFLAECGNVLTVVDASPSRLADWRATCEALALSETDWMVADSLGAVSIPAGTIDGAWVDGEWFERCGRAAVFAALREWLKPGGRLHVHGAVGPAAVIERIVEGDVSAIDRFGRGLSHEGPGGFFDLDRLVKILKARGFASDANLPPSARRIADNREVEPPLGRDYAVIAERLRDPAFRQSVRDQPDLLRGLERVIHFSATLNPD